jgi:hypothetical protein
MPEKQNILNICNPRLLSSGKVLFILTVLPTVHNWKIYCVWLYSHGSKEAFFHSSRNNFPIKRCGDTQQHGLRIHTGKNKIWDAKYKQKNVYSLQRETLTFSNIFVPGSFLFYDKKIKILSIFSASASSKNMHLHFLYSVCNQAKPMRQKPCADNCFSIWKTNTKICMMKQRQTCQSPPTFWERGVEEWGGGWNK